MKLKKIVSLLLAGTMAASLLVGCGGASSSTAPADTNTGASTSAPAGEVTPTSGSMEGKRVRVVIGSTSTGGDSYMVAELVTRYLGEEMGFNGKVDAVGNAAALEALTSAKADGTTIMMFHDMIFLSVLFGSVGEEYALENLTVGPRIGQNPGACFAANAAAPYDSLSGAAEWLVENPDEQITVNIESGSTSHLAFAVFWMWAKETHGEEVANRIKAVVGGTTDEKKQRLWDGNCDVIFGDYSSFVEFTKDGIDAQLAMKIMDPLDAIEGESIPTMADNGVTFNGEEFVFSKDFAMYFPADMDPALLAEFEVAMQNVAANPEFQAEMANLKYKAVAVDATTVTASEEFLMAKRETSKAIIEAAPSLDTLS